MSRFSLDKRAPDGIWSSRYGSGIRYTKWKKRSDHASLEEALEARKQGLWQYRIRYKGKIIFDSSSRSPKLRIEGLAVQNFNRQMNPTHQPR